MTILIISPRFPLPAQKGDQLRIMMFLRYLTKRHRVLLACTAESRLDEKQVAEVRDMVDGLFVVDLPTWQRAVQLARFSLYGTPFQVGFFYSPKLRRLVRNICHDEHVDVVLCQMARTAPYGLALPGIPKVLEYQDAYSLNMEQRFRQESGLKRWVPFLEWQLMRRYEKKILPLFNLATIISERDRKAVGDDRRLRLLPHGMNFEPQDMTKKRWRIVFSGNLHYFPNCEAIIWFSRQVFPLIRKNIPDATLDIVGATPTEEVLALRELPGVDVIPDVPDIRSYIGRAEVSVAPMRSGSGTQTKVLEALALGTPVVITPHARLGLDHLSDEVLLVAPAHPGDFAKAVITLFNDRSRRDDMVRVGREQVMTYYSWESVGKQLESVLLEAVSGDTVN